MALTATAQSALPSWDETIVPSLRKSASRLSLDILIAEMGVNQGLENESRMLSKRLSNTSMSDEDAYNLRTRPPAAPSPAAASSYYNGYEHPSAPRTSSQSSRPAAPSVTVTSSPSRPSPAKRNRTYSQPWTPGEPGSSSRSNSPMVDRNADYVRPSRIPVARTRTPSISSSNPPHGTSSAAAYHPANGYAASKDKESAADLWSVKETRAETTNSPQMVSVPLRHQNSRIINEQAPFPPDSIGSSYRSKATFDYNSTYPSAQQARDDVDEPVGRMSNESEERPFEHWYRGDTSRNGGVGELRVGKRMEMLEIAQHGHSLRSKHFGPSGPGSRAASRADVRDVVGGRRKRADSLGARESFYLDEAAQEELARVLDERPLTDSEREAEDEEGVNGHAQMDIDSPSEDDDIPQEEHTRAQTPRAGARSVTPTNPRPQAGRTTTAPAAQTIRSGSEPPFASTSKASPSPARSPKVQTPRQRTRSQPRLLETPPSTPASKRRASPGPVTNSPASAGKKPKTVAQRRVPQADRKEEHRRSIGEYPDVEDSLDGETSLIDAIPKWTQPKIANGNWEDVVLPAVAKKKGLDEQYEQVDGSPKVIQQRGSFQYEPVSSLHPCAYMRIFF
jgi:hypothetical protein